MSVPGFRLIGAAPDPGTAQGALALLTDRAGRLILQLRDDRAGVRHPGRWGLFGGGVEPGETLETALIRELREETGLTVPQGAAQPFAWVQSESAARTRIHVFTLTLDVTPADITLGEGSGFAFVSPEKAAGLDLVPVLKPVLMAYLQG